MPTETDLPTGFYSGDPRKRVSALANTSGDMRDTLLSQLPQWPMMSPGSLNAWLVFLGPSPGNSPGGAWAYDPKPSIGHAHPGVAEYVDRRGFWNRIRDYSRVVHYELGASDAYAATMVRNLDPIQSATAPTGSHMNMAAKEVVEVLGKTIRPRLVIALGGSRKYTDVVFREMIGTIEHKVGTLYTALSGHERRWFSLIGTWDCDEPFLYVSPAGIHPSIRHVSHDDSLDFMRKQSDEARALTS